MDGTVEDSSHLVVHLDEILQLIFAELKSKADLHSCVLVCRKWASMTIPLLWKYYNPDIEFLLAMHKSDALIKYVDLMQHFLYQCHCCTRQSWSATSLFNQEAHEFIKNIGNIYPQLRIVSLKIHGEIKGSREEDLRTLVRSSLRHAHTGRYLNLRNMLRLLEANCPNLESIDIDYGISVFPADVNAFHSFLSKLPRLRKIGGDCLRLWSSHVVAVFRLQQLEELTADFHTIDWLERLLAYSGDYKSLAPALRNLDIGGRPVKDADIAFMLSLGLFPRLQKFSVRSAEPSDGIDVIGHLSRYSNLVHVDIRLNTRLQDEAKSRELLPVNLLATFHGCQELRTFRFSYVAHPRYGLPVSGCFPVNGGYLNEIFSALPRIRLLALPFSCTLGSNVLQIIRDSCPELSELHFPKSCLDYAELLADPYPPVLEKMNNLDLSWYRGDELPAPSPDTPPLEEEQRKGVISRILPCMFERLEQPAQIRNEQ